MEIYKDVPGYEKIYQVSNLGNVKSLSRFIDNGSSGYQSKEKSLRKTKNKVNGYFYVSLCVLGKPVKFNVHQIVAMAFLDHKPDKTNKLVVDHIDTDKENNILSNLQIITNRENCTKDKIIDRCNVKFRAVNKKEKTSRYVGVYFYAKRNRYRARIRMNGVRKDLGQFKTEEEANIAYQKALNNYELN